MRAFVAVCLIFGSALLVAQSPEPTAGAPGGSQATPAAQATTELPVRRVILYKTGIGYFEHLGRVRGSQPVTLRFTSAQLDDVLKSLTALDLSQGRVTGIAYNSIAPIEQRLGALRLPLGGDTTSRELLHALRGARLEVSSGGAAVQGRLLSVEQRTRVRASGAEPVDVITLITDAGALHSVDLTPAARVRLVERDLRRDINTYLDVIGSAREQDVRSMVIATAGTGDAICS